MSFLERIRISCSSSSIARFPRRNCLSCLYLLLSLSESLLRVCLLTSWDYWFLFFFFFFNAVCPKASEPGVSVHHAICLPTELWNLPCLSLPTLPSLLSGLRCIMYYVLYLLRQSCWHLCVSGFFLSCILSPLRHYSIDRCRQLSTSIRSYRLWSDGRTE